MVKMGRLIEKDIKAEELGRKAAARKGTSDKLSPVVKGKSRELVAQLLGTYGKYITEQAALRYSNSRTSFKVISSVLYCKTETALYEAVRS
jgi:hypothetical protein